jgi:hypothetical protein
MLLDSDPDRAAYLAGYVLELMLKGRYADLKAWTDYPDLHEIKRRGAREIVDHDLDNLVALARAEGLKTGAMLEVDWERICRWDVAQRYTPVGTLQRDAVEAQLSEVEKAFHQIVDYMVLDKLIDFETALTKRFGLFNFFAFVQNARTSGWGLWYAMWACPGGPPLMTDEVEARLTEALDEDLRAAVGYVQAFHPNAPAIQAFNQMTALAGAVVHGRLLLKDCIVMPFGLLPNAYVITNGDWAPEVLQEAWQQIPG